MGKLHAVQINVNDCIKEISVFCDDVTTFTYPIDILTTSAFVGSYSPTPRTIFKALDDFGISVKKLAHSPEFDLRTPCHIWLSKKINTNSTNISRIGCVELIEHHMPQTGYFEVEQNMINAIRAYFQMLDIASLYGVNMTTLALPFLGGGIQNISAEMLLTPLINECIAFLKRNQSIKNIYFIDKNPNNAKLLAEYLKKSLRFSNAADTTELEKEEKKWAFISYSSKDRNIADNLCSKLENNGIKVWYAPRNVNGPYAESIVKGIDKSSYFIVILSQNSIASEHVLNEIDLAFQNVSQGLKFKPLRIDDTMFTPSFKYYLSRQHWMDATLPPLEERLNEFVSDILNDYKK